MNLSDKGLALIAGFEAPGGVPVLTAYQDGAGIWTICYGHTQGVEEGDTATPELCMSYLQDDTRDATEDVNDYISSSATTQEQFDAMVSLAFNIGRANFASSTVLRSHNIGNYQTAADAFLLWDKMHVDGQLVASKGLHNRRWAERAWYSQ
jgi:lysozyme